MVTLKQASELIYKKLYHWLEDIILNFPNLVVAFLILLFFLLLARIFKSLAKKFLGKISHNPNIDTLLANLVFIFILTSGLFISLGVLKLDKVLTSLLAGAGILGLALSFAFQDIAQNLIAGIGMALKRPFQIGDLVETGGKMGYVREINIRTTVLQNLQGMEIQIPNKDVYQNVIINYVRNENNILIIPFSLKLTESKKDFEQYIKRKINEINEVSSSEIFFIEMHENLIKGEIHVQVQSDSLNDIRHKIVSSLIDYHNTESTK